MQKPVPIQFGATFVVPPDEQSKLNLQKAVFPDKDSKSIFDQYFQALNADAAFTIQAEYDGVQVKVFFRWNGTTAGTAIWAFDGDRNQPKHIHGVSVLVGKKNEQNDAKAFETAKAVKAVHRIKPEQFDRVASSVNTFGIATFFSDVNSANYPPLITFIETLAAAFFHRLATRQLLN